MVHMKYLDDHDGKPSSMRLMALLALIAAIGLGFVEVLVQGANHSEIILYFLIAAFAPKAMQKVIEQRGKNGRG